MTERLNNAEGDLFSACSICDGRGEVERNEGAGDWHTCMVCGGQRYLPSGLSRAQGEVLTRQLDDTLEKVKRLEALLRRWLELTDIKSTTQYELVPLYHETNVILQIERGAIWLSDYDGKEERE